MKCRTSVVAHPPKPRSSHGREQDAALLQYPRPQLRTRLRPGCLRSPWKITCQCHAENGVKWGTTHNNMPRPASSPPPPRSSHSNSTWETVACHITAEVSMPVVQVVRRKYFGKCSKKRHDITQHTPCGTSLPSSASNTTFGHIRHYFTRMFMNGSPGCPLHRTQVVWEKRKASFNNQRTKRVRQIWSLLTHSHTTIAR